MDGPRHERRRHFRGKARPGRIMPVRFRTQAHAAWTDAETRNIGVGGAYIASGSAPPVGTTLTVELTLPTTDQVFTLPAVVRWSNAGDGAHARSPDADEVHLHDRAGRYPCRPVA